MDTTTALSTLCNVEKWFNNKLYIEKKFTFIPL